MDRQQEFALRMVEERDVHFVRLWFTDVVGSLKSIAIAPAEVEGAFEEGIGFDGSAIEGLARMAESDMLLRPDPSTFQLLPWRGDQGPTARMFCDVFTPDGDPVVSDPRYVLQKVLKKAAGMGFTAYTHPEIEFYILKSDRLGDDGEPIPVDYGGYFDHVPGSVTQDLRRQIVNTLEAMGISVEFSHHEAGYGQNEIDLRYADALQTADNVMTMRTVVKEIALEFGVYVTFMPKPFSSQPGSGMHTHFSLFEGDNNAFYEAGAQYRLSLTGRQFIAGILSYATEFTAVTNQYVNSYRRLWGGQEAPSYVSWGHNNRSALVRVPSYKPSKGQSARIEYRGMDSAVNPYLAYAVILAAGLRGIEEGRDLPDAVDGDLAQMSANERKVIGATPLPSSLHAAILRMEESDFMPEVLGEQVFDFFLRNKRQEWDDFRHFVTPYELRTGLPQL